MTKLHFAVTKFMQKEITTKWNLFKRKYTQYHKLVYIRACYSKGNKIKYPSVLSFDLQNLNHICSIGPYGFIASENNQLEPSLLLIHEVVRGSFRKI